MDGLKEYFADIKKRGAGWYIFGWILVLAGTPALLNHLHHALPATGG